VGTGGGVTLPEVGVRTPVGVGPLRLDVGVPVGEDVGVPVGEGMVGWVVVGVPEVGGGAVPVVRLGWGPGLFGLSMTGAPPEGLVAAGEGAGRTQR
jgi:hypothetical protein